MSSAGYHAFIDESGQRSNRGKSSPHFVMSAVVIPSDRLDAAAQFVGELRTQLGRRPGDVLHWRNYNEPERRLAACRAVAGRGDTLRVCSVVACKDYLDTTSGWGADVAYLYTLRFLLERLSWLARDGHRAGHMTYTLGHVRRFPMWKLREYEKNLRFVPTEISWERLRPAEWCTSRT